MWLRTGKALTIAALLLVQSGCAGYRQVSAWGGQADLPGGPGEAVEAGARVRVTMHTGDEIYGTLVEISTAEIVLLRGRGDRTEELRIAARDIQAVEEEHTSVARTVALAVLLAAAAGIGYLANSFATGLGGMN